jgi:hypothetical protein
MKFRVFWDVAPCSHVQVDQRFRGVHCDCLMMEAVHTSETLINSNVTTKRYNTEDYTLYSRRFLCGGTYVLSASYRHQFKP